MRRRHDFRDFPDREPPLDEEPAPQEAPHYYDDDQEEDDGSDISIPALSWLTN
jgi:hypothetical protein